jgi:glycine/D-amino acid oxidase-like deaminating enzyme
MTLQAAAPGSVLPPTLGRLLADVARGEPPGYDVAPLRTDRPALTDPAYDPHWGV